MAAVMGWPVMHSRSPKLHNYWFRKYALSGAYLPLEIRPEGLEAALRALHPLGFAGCNLTIPHKQEALKYVDEIDPVARKIGAISCVVVRDDGTLTGSNNDWFGFMENIYEGAPDWKPGAGPVAVLGAGGGARAVVWGLMNAGVRQIRLVNRTRERAEGIRTDFADAIPEGGQNPIEVIGWDERTDAVEGCAMVVNATSQGMQGMPPLDIALDRLTPATIAADIIYIPKETPFLADARARGCHTVNGLGMLLHQGRPAWKAWFNRDVEVTRELRAEIEATI